MLIAELGQNHLGNMDLAKRMILLAKDAGSDLVKFQLYDHKKLYGDKSIPNVELSFEQAKMLFDYGASIGIEVFFSVFDVERVQWCEKIGVKRYKIANSQVNKLESLGEIPSPIIYSKQLFQAIHPYLSGGEPPYFYKLLVVPKYPALPSDYKIGWVNFGCDYQGLSDHTIGLDLAKIALARGAQIIEKHFAIDHKTGVDAEWSMTPDELRELKRWEQVCQAVLR